jgi:hypothetical protein
MKIMSLMLPYLLLVSFGVNFHSLDQQKINLINQSPYQGVAVPLISAYDSRKYDWQDFAQSVQRIKTQAKKQIWPWVFFNRFYGWRDHGHIISPLANNLYFRNIKGIDLYNRAGALADFYNLWRISLRSAKELGSPGVLVDPEAYNNYGMYALSTLADQIGGTPREIKSRLKAVGGEIVRIAMEEYPDVKIWFTFTGIASPIPGSEPGGLRTPAYIVQGMLEKAKKTGAKVKIISGGTVSLGYCYKSLEDLKNVIKKRKQNIDPVLVKYPNLGLAGTIAPWADARQKQGWTLKRKCGEATMQNLDDFKPLIRELLKNYDYVWIYAGSAAGYHPYDPQNAAIYNKAIREALATLPEHK